MLAEFMPSSALRGDNGADFEALSKVVVEKSGIVVIHISGLHPEARRELLEMVAQKPPHPRVIYFAPERPGSKVKGGG